MSLSMTLTNATLGSHWRALFIRGVEFLIFDHKGTWCIIIYGGRIRGSTLVWVVVIDRMCSQLLPMLVWQVLHTVSMLIRIVALLRLLRGYVVLANTVLNEGGNLSLGDVRNGS